MNYPLPLHRARVAEPRSPLAWLLALLLLALGLSACQKAKPDVAEAAAYYTCSMHPQIHEDGPGKCPICHMDLIPVPPAAVVPPPPKAAVSAAVFTCPMHAQVRENEPGQCPICGMDLVKISARPTVKTSAIEPADTPATKAAADDLILTAQQMELGNIRVQTIGAAGAGTAPHAAPAADVAPPAVLTGTVTANATRTASISSRVAGRVEQLFVRQNGQLLRRGEPLFSVYSEELQTLQHEYALALAQAAQAPDNPAYRRFAAATAQKLRLLGVSAGQLRRLAGGGQPSPLVTYYSPQAGTVQTLAVTQGQYVSEGSPLLTLSDLSSVWVEAQLYPAEAGRLPVGTAVTVQVAGQAPARHGRVVFLSPELSGSSQVVLARIMVPNPDGALQPGAQANVLLSSAPASVATAGAETSPTAAAPTAALRVPQAAIIHDGAESYLWKQTGERQFRRVQVRTGEGTAATVSVRAGVQPGDRVVTTGAYLLESEFTLRQGAPDEHMSGMAM